jgi:hypothetical protein
MRKALLSLAGATALALGSAANAAAVVVGGVSGLNNPDPSAPGSIVESGNVTTINFGQNPLQSPSFSGSFTIDNITAGMYTILMGSSFGATFSSATLTAVVSGVDGTVYSLHDFPDNTNLKLDATTLDAGSYRFDFAGDAQSQTSFTGNIRIAAVPEPATWAMMIVGFGAMGVSLRRRRRQVLAQVA